MATSTSDVTGNSALAVRGTSVLLNGLISAAVAGSILIAGNIHTDRSANTAGPQLLYGTGTYLGYKDNGPNGCTNITANPGSNSNHCGFQLSTTQTGSIMRVQYDYYKNPNAAPVKCSVSSAQTSGTSATITNLNGQGGGTASGGTLVNSTGAYIVPPGWYVRCWPTKVTGNAYTQLRVWYNLLFVP